MAIYKVVLKPTTQQLEYSGITAGNHLIYLELTSGGTTTTTTLSPTTTTTTTTFTPEFVTITFNNDLYQPALVGTDGSFKYAASFPDCPQPFNGDNHNYDISNKLLIYGDNIYGYVYIFDCNDINLETYKSVNIPSGNFNSISFVNNNWIVGNNSNNAYFTGSTTYNNFTSINTSIFGGTIPTSGSVNRVKYNTTQSDYFYSTDNGEIGIVYTIGDTSAIQILDILTYGVNISTGNNKIIAHSTATDRWSLTTTPTTWNNIGPYNINRIERFNSTLDIGIENNSKNLYYINYAVGFPGDPPVFTDINPTGYDIYDIIVDGSTVYLSAIETSTNDWKILIDTNFSITPSFSVYKSVTGSLHRFFKYN
jgi:hypothetical protein